MSLKNQKKRLQEALEEIHDEKSIIRILNFVKEEAAVYNVSKNEPTWETMHQWQKDEITIGAKQIHNGDYISHNDSMLKLRSLK